MSTGLAHRLDDLGRANAQGLLDDDEYRLLRRNLFELHAAGEPQSHKNPPTPPSPQPAPRPMPAVAQAVAGLLRKATGRKPPRKPVLDLPETGKRPRITRRSSEAEEHRITYPAPASSPSSSVFTSSVHRSLSRRSHSRTHSHSNSLVSSQAHSQPPDVFDDDPALDDPVAIRVAIRATEDEATRLAAAFADLEQSTLRRIHRQRARRLPARTPTSVAVLLEGREWRAHRVPPAPLPAPDHHALLRPPPSPTSSTHSHARTPSRSKSHAQFASSSSHPPPPTSSSTSRSDPPALAPTRSVPQFPAPPRIAVSESVTPPFTPASPPAASRSTSRLGFISTSHSASRSTSGSGSGSGSTPTTIASTNTSASYTSMKDKESKDTQPHSPGLGLGAGLAAAIRRKASFSSLSLSISSRAPTPAGLSAQGGHSHSQSHAVTSVPGQGSHAHGQGEAQKQGDSQRSLSRARSILRSGSGTATPVSPPYDKGMHGGAGAGANASTGASTNVGADVNAAGNPDAGRGGKAKAKLLARSISHLGLRRLGARSAGASSSSGSGSATASGEKEKGKKSTLEPTFALRSIPASVSSDTLKRDAVGASPSKKPAIAGAGGGLSPRSSPTKRRVEKERFNGHANGARERHEKVDNDRERRSASRGRSRARVEEMAYLDEDADEDDFGYPYGAGYEEYAWPDDASTHTAATGASTHASGRTRAHASPTGGSAPAYDTSGSRHDAGAAELADIRARRAALEARYAARVEYLTAKLRGAEIRERVMRR